MATTIDNWFKSRRSVEQYFNSQNPKLSITDSEITKMYSCLGDKVVNSYLRRQFLASTIIGDSTTRDSTVEFSSNKYDDIDPIKLHKDLLTIFTKVKPLDMNIRVFRGVAGYDWFTYNNIRIGQTYMEAGFTLTTIMCCADMYPTYAIHNMTITFVIPKGKSVLFLNEKFDNSNYKEYEILLAPNSRFSITDKSIINGQKFLFAEILS